MKQTLLPFEEQRITKKELSSIKPRVLSLFSGCGGMDLGFIKAGYEIVYASDIDKKLKATYEKNIGPINIIDIQDIDKESLPDSDIVCAGIPCQPFSSAGNRGSTSDSRGNLFLEVMKVLDAKQPKVVLFENVRGFTSSKDENGVPMPERVRAELKKHGYTLSYKLLNASDYEVPQNRYRVFLIGIREDLEVEFQFPLPIEKNHNLTVGAILTKPLPKNEKQEVWILSPQTKEIAKHITEGGSWKQVPYSALPERMRKIRDNVKKYRAPNFYRRFARSEIMGTITAAATPENSGILHPLEPRRYSVREIARYQSFPDKFKFLGDSISAKYKMIGNAVPVNLACHIAVALKKSVFYPLSRNCKK